MSALPKSRADAVQGLRPPRQHFGRLQLAREQSGVTMPPERKRQHAIVGVAFSGMIQRVPN